MANYYIPLVATPQIGEGGGGGGSGLPAVTAADNGDVLTVVNGAWDKAASSGGGGVLVVNVTDGTCDKTWQEIHDAFASTGAVFSLDDTLTACTEVGFSSRAQKYYVEVAGNDYFATTASDYPVLDEGE